MVRMIRPEELKKDQPLVWSTGTGSDVWGIFQAAIAGDVPSLERLLDKDPSLVRGQFAYLPPLYFAVRENQVQAAAFLLQRGANPMPFTGGHDSLTGMARERGYAEMETLLRDTLARVHGVLPQAGAVAASIRERDLATVRSLLDASPELLHAGDERSNQPIHWAVMTRQIDLIDELLSRGAHINARRSDGARPIQLTNGDYHYRGWRDSPEDTATPREVLAHLRARGAYCDICTAAYIGDLARVRELLDQDATLANRPSEYVTYYACSGTPLRNAAAAGNMEIVKLLLERGADPNLPEEGIAPRGHALYSAVYHRHLEVARFLLEKGAYPNVAVESSADTLSIAILHEDQPAIRLLCAHGAARPVHLLAYYGDLQTAAAVFAANPALTNDPEALSNAADESHEDFVRLMLRYQPDLATRISQAAKTPALTELLFQHGMDPNRPDWLMVTPLHKFAAKGDVESATIFLDHGADLDARDEDQRSTPLGYAAKSGRTAMVEFLLQRGARPNLPDDPPWATPLAWATSRGHTGIVQLLTKE